MLIKNIIIALFILLANIGHAQISEFGIPWSKDWSLAQESVPSYDLAYSEIKKPANNSSNTDLGTTPMQFAHSIYVNKNSDEHGVWTDLADGSRVWRMHLVSEGAYSLNFTFSKFDIPKGGKVYIYNKSYSKILGAFTQANMNKSGTLAIAPLAGEELIIEYNEPAESIFSGYLAVGYLGHDYKGLFAPADENFGRSGECNVDINCADGEDWQVEKKAVCRMVINNTEVCSGALVNNALQDGEPFVITANHCVNSQVLAENTIFVFNYESPSCGGIDGSVDYSISGADLVATKNKDQGFLDFSLLRLNRKVPLEWNPYFMGWDAREKIAENTVCIHHPWADVKKISVDEESPTQSSYFGSDGFDPNTFWKIDEWEVGMTQGGSSGCPLFSDEKRLIGTLTGGDAMNCDDDPVNDYFQMFSASYDKYDEDSMQLKNWLDPLNSGILAMDGYEPTDYDIEVDDLIMVSNFEAEDPLAFFVADAGGYLAGNNIYQDKKKAEFFDEQLFGGRTVVTNVHVAFAYAKGNGEESIEMELYNTENIRPHEVLGTSTVALSTIIENADNDFVTFNFNPPVVTSGSVFASITLPQNVGDTIAIMNIDTNVVAQNTAWEYNFYDQWWPYDNEEYTWGIKTAHVMFLEIGNLVTGIEDNLSSSFLVYPNPAKHQLTIESTEYESERRLVSISDALGRNVFEHTLNPGENNLSFDLSAWQSGIYIIQIIADNKIFTEKLMVE